MPGTQQPQSWENYADSLQGDLLSPPMILVRRRLPVNIVHWCKENPLLLRAGWELKSCQACSSGRLLPTLGYCPKQIPSSASTLLHRLHILSLGISSVFSNFEVGISSFCMAGTLMAGSVVHVVLGDSSDSSSSPPRHSTAI